MAKRELSNTLKNLKFMQRGAQKEEKPKEQETKPQGSFISPSNVSRKCMVIMEGDPHPETVRGRMSFQNFNPSVDKLNDDASTSATFQSGRGVNGSNSPSEQSEKDMSNSDGEHKRKQPEANSQTSNPRKLKKKSRANNEPSSSGNHSSQKQSKQDKLDWNVLMPPTKSQSRKQ